MNALSHRRRQHNLPYGMYKRVYVDHAALIQQFANLNRLKRQREFDMEALGLGSHSRKSFESVGWPGADHVTHLKRDGRPAAIITEPYDAGEVDEAREFAATFGLICHQPPNPRASFWYPGWTFIVVITRPDFGAVRWIPDQLSFKEGRRH